MNELEILFEDNHLLVVNKPPCLATMGAADAPTVHELACRYIADKYAKPGKVFLGVVHRLDSMSSGVLVLARTSKAASRLSEQFRRSSEGPTKIYLAAVEGDVVEPRGHWRDWIAKNEAAHRMEAATAATTGAVDAELEYRVLSHSTTTMRSTLVSIRLLTGRKHQIRVQFADRGHAVIGDIKYGAAKQSFHGIALHAWSLTIVHPTKATAMTFRAPPPQQWGQWRPTAADLTALDQAGAW
jgi:23S rRNA pseudouridine1911/1915/1917 synthase